MQPNLTASGGACRSRACKVACLCEGALPPGITRSFVIWRAIGAFASPFIRATSTTAAASATLAHEGGHAPGSCSRYPGQDGGGYPAPRVWQFSLSSRCVHFY
jgi:hypothetical protein